MKNLYSLTLLIILMNSFVYSQNVGINATGAAPNSSAILDISANNKGILIPNVFIDSISDKSAIALPATALLIYNTNNSFLNGLNGDGFYYNKGTTTIPDWVRLLTSNNDAWSLTGNSSTSNINFIGTKDNKRLQFRVNNMQAGLIDTLNGRRNTLFGLNAGVNITSAGVSNTFIGNEAGNATTFSDANVIIGDSAGYSNTASNNVIIGASAGKNNFGANGIFIGARAAYNNTNAIGNVAIGNHALYRNVFGGRNLAVGDSAGYENTNSGSTFIGYGSGRNANPTNGDNTFIGSLCGYASTTGSSNTFIGANAGIKNTTGASNIFIGKYVAQNNTEGNDNTILGNFGAPFFTIGLQNVIIGNSTAQNLISGDKNVIIGYDAGDNIAKSNNVVIGNNADLADSNLVNATAIGDRAIVNASNSMVLGSISGINGATQTVSVGIGTQRPQSRLDDSGSLGLAIRTTTASTTFTINDHTIILTTTATVNITFDLPIPSTCKRREYVIVNHNAASATRIFDVNYIEFNGTTPTIIPTGAITIQSDGMSWYRIR